MSALLALVTSVVAAPFNTPVTGAPTPGPFLVLDIDGDGTAETLVAVDDRLLVLDAQGNVRSETTVPANALGPSSPAGASPQKLIVQSGLTLCDVEPSLAPVVVFVTSDRRLFALAIKQGRWLAGFPISLDAASAGPVVCAELDGSAKKYVIVGTQAGTIYAFVGAKPAPGFPIKLDKPITAIAAGATKPSEHVRILAATEDGLLHARASDGKPLDGFPVSVGYRLGGPPVIGDIDDDGEAEIVAASQDFKIYAFKPNGALVAGFPFSAGYRFYAAPALGDIDGDGVLDIVAASADGKVYAVSGAGRVLPGFPVLLGPKLGLSPLVGDVDGSGKNTILVTANDGRIFVLDSEGRAGPPLNAGDSVKTAPLLAAHGEQVALHVVGTKTVQQLEPFKRSAPFDPTTPLAWPMAGHDAEHASRYFPNAGRFRLLRLLPGSPNTNDVLRPEYVYFDLDGDPEQDTQVRWYRNGVMLPEMNNRREIPPELTKKHEVYQFTLQEGRAFKKHGDNARLSRVFKSPMVKIKNTRPTAALVAIGPDAPSNHADLSAVIKRPAQDEDGDPLTYDYRWLLDRKPQKLALTQNRIGRELTQKHQRWTLIVVARDDEEEGPPSSAETTILNTPPGAPHARLEPATPTVTQDLHAIITQAGLDDDGDPVSYRYVWSIDGEMQALSPLSDTLPKSRLHKNRDIAVTITAFDGEEPGGQLTLKTRSVNTLPLQPAIAFAPAHARKASGLQVVLAAPAVDADGDLVSYSLAWALGGNATADAGWRLEPRQLKKGQRWQVAVTASDDESAQVAARAEAVVLNTPPHGLRIALDDHRPRATAESKVRVVTPGSDDDGDAITLRYHWLKDGRTQPFSADKDALLPGETKKGEHWRVIATSSDGTDDGDTAALNLTVINTLPSAPRVALSPEHARTGDALTANITATSRDDDGDSLLYRYRWYVEGKRLALPEGTRVLPPGTVQKEQAVRVEVFAFDGEGEGPAGFAGLIVQNTGPSRPRVQLSPAKPTVQTSLECRFAAPALDADGDKLELEREWLLDDKPFLVSASAPAIAADQLRRGQRWSCRARAFDGKERGPWSDTVTATIANSPPSAPALALSPAGPRVGEELNCFVATSSLDADRDPLRYAFSWWKNGQRQLPLVAARLPRGALRRGDRWVCGVTVTDGISVSAEVRVETVVINTKPTAPDVAIFPPMPSVGDGLECRITVPATDADGDLPTYGFQWLKNGVVQLFAATTTHVPPRLVRAAEVWSCEASAFDGQAASEAGHSSEVTIGP